MIIPILKMGQLKMGEVKSVAQQHTASKEKRVKEGNGWTCVEGRAVKQKGREGRPHRQDQEGQSLLTREVLCTVLVPTEVVVLVPSGKGKGEATG